MNIGANDVANNVGLAVGSKALTMGGDIARELKKLEKKEDKKKKDYQRIANLYSILEEESAAVKEAKKQLKSDKQVQYVKEMHLKKL